MDDVIIGLYSNVWLGLITIRTQVVKGLISNNWGGVLRNLLRHQVSCLFHVYRYCVTCLQEEEEEEREEKHG